MLLVRGLAFGSSGPLPHGRRAAGLGGRDRGLKIPLHVAEQAIERLEAGLPLRTELLRPRARVLEGRGLEAAQTLAPRHPAPHQLGALERADVLGRGGEGHAEGRREFAEVEFALDEAADHRPAHGVGEGVEDAVEGGGSI